MPVRSGPLPRTAVVVWRIAWTIVSLVVVQTAVCGLAATPVVLLWRWWVDGLGGRYPTMRWALVSVAIAPSYVLFALSLLVISPLVLRGLRWRTPPDAELRIADMEWALLRWVRFGASLHVVRLVSGALLRGTPLWSLHLRLCGARLGKRVYVNSLSVSDYNLIECGDGVVIGAGVHLSGHTVEAGVVKTARVRIGDRVTIGLGSVIEIGAEIGADAQIGALSFVPKGARLQGGLTYVGAPARPLHSSG